ncbi:hypothetical protein [Chamaesiphon sp. VAR_48_metabat_135_sub]|nr:hypothetical protein [Chamaesiphon sp. VAR_48_metabat_135_sub]
MTIRWRSLPEVIEDIYQLLAQLKIEILPIEWLDLDRYLTLPLHHL